MGAHPGETGFAEFLLSVGSNSIEKYQAEPFSECIPLPQRCVINPTENEQNGLDTLINKIFPSGCSQELVQTSVILTPTNKISLTINDKILDQMPGELVQCFSADQAILEDNGDPNLYPI